MAKTDNLIFLSYSRKDAEFVRKLYLELRKDGFNIWFDQEEIIPGQKWQQTVREVMSSVRAVLLCLSSNWIDKRGYVQKEMKLALELLKEFPTGDIYIIPIRLDDCPIPSSLAALHYLDVWNEENFSSLKENLIKILGAGFRRVYGTERNIQLIENDDGVESAGLESPERYRNLLTGWDSAEEQAIKLKFGFLNQSVDLLKDQDYAAVLKLWKEVEDFEEFDLRHETWNKMPTLRLPLLLAKSHLLYSRIHLNQISYDDDEVHVPKAYKIIQEILEFPPYEIKGKDAGERFDQETMDVQNQNYRDLLLFIRSWFNGWSPAVLEGLFKIPHAETEMLLTRVEDRLSEVARLLPDV
jgi:TIR domain-containing protein